jgi:hypothetical protein
VFSIIISGIFVQIVFIVFREYIFDFFFILCFDDFKYFETYSVYSDYDVYATMIDLVVSMVVYEIQTAPPTFLYRQRFSMRSMMSFLGYDGL